LLIYDSDIIFISKCSFSHLHILVLTEIFFVAVCNIDHYHVLLTFNYMAFTLHLQKTMFETEFKGNRFVAS